MQLPIVDTATPAHPSRANPARDLGWHALRMLMIVGSLVGLHFIAGQRSAVNRSRTQAPTLPQVQKLLPAARSLRPLSEGSLQVLDVNGNPMGMVASTSPLADSVVGYSGPNNVLILLSEDQTVESLRLIDSGDTREHVRLVEDAPEFWRQFVGLRLGANAAEDSRLANVDGVSGATLTSLAIAEAIALRMNGQRLSLRFPTEVTLAEVQKLVPEAERIEADRWNRFQAWRTYAHGDRLLGLVVRTGHCVDAVEGYQGPSELLFLLSPEGILLDAELRESYDNQPYVSYVTQEASFWKVFQQRPLRELSTMDLAAEGIEGVSGATMTSMAVAETILQAARQLSVEPPRRSDSGQNWNWSWLELATLLIAVASIPWSRSHLRSRRLPRLIWQLACFSVLGLMAGNLLSLALLAGWTRAGIPIHLAPGLSALLLVSLVWPAVSKTNVYCDHVCPHGVLQQWMRPLRIKHSPSLGWHRISRGVASGFRLLGWICVAYAVVWILRDGSIALSDLEPFDAYAWRVGISVSLAIWLGSVGLAFWQPMAYCRLACPTGRLLGIARRARRTSGSGWVDIGLAALLALVLWQVWQTS